MVEELKGTMDPEKRVALIQKIARYKHENVLGGMPTYRPVVTLAWRDKIEFRPGRRRAPGARSRKIGLKK